MKLKLLVFPVLLTALAACVREMPEIPETKPEAGQVTDSEQAPSYVKVLFSEEMCDLVEEDLSLGQVRTRSEGLNGLVDELGIESMERLFPFAGEFEPRTRKEGLHRWYKVSYAEDVPVTRATRAFESLPGVEMVEEPLKASLTTNDKYWGDMWGLNNTRYPGMDVNVQEVWENYSVGNPDVVVAVIDGGIDLNHPDLAWNCLPSGHKSYVPGAANVVGHDHGTHVAGTIAAVSNNGIGVAGIAGGNYAEGRRGISLLSQQCFYTVGSGANARDRSGDFETAIKEAADKGALISSNSWGYNFDADDDGVISNAELASARSAHQNVQYYSIARAIDYFVKYAGCDNDGNQLPDSPMKGGVVIFAAGNEDIPYGPPANYEPVIAVGAIAQNGQRAAFSNYGEWVDISAPGMSIPSTIPGDEYASYSGTSMACPHVSGVAALVVSRYGGPGFTNDELKARLLGSGNPDIAGVDEIGPLVDAYGAVVFGGIDPPDGVTQFTAASTSNYIDCTFTAGTAYGYYAIAGKTEEAVLAADPFHPDGQVILGHLLFPDGTRRGETVTVRVEGLAFEEDYFVTVRSYNYNREIAAPAPAQRIHTGVNHPPVIEMAGSDFNFRHNERVRIPIRLYDPDGHRLNLDFQTDGLATLESKGKNGDYAFLLNCTMVENTPASFRAKIVLTDPYGMGAEKSFTYSVQENHAPVAVKPLENVRISAPGGQYTVDLKDCFTDPDEEPVFFTVLSLDNALLHASCTDGVMTVTALSEGAGQLSITAADGLGTDLTVRQGILVRPDGVSLTLEPGTVIEEKLIIRTGLNEKDTRIRLLNASGNSLYDATVTCSAFEPAVIRTDGLAPGRYTLSVNSGGETVRKTVVRK